MALAVGDIVAVKINGLLLGQRTITTFHYFVASPGSSPSTIAALDQFNAYFAAYAFGPYATFLECVPVTWVNEFNTVQQVTPVLSVARFNVLVDPGTRGAATTANLAAVVTKGTNFGGRDQVGSWHLPGVAAADQTGGDLIAALEAKMVLFGTSTLLSLTDPVTGIVFSPGLFHRNPEAPLTSTITPLTRAVPQTTIRVMRRRTVGFGI